MSKLISQETFDDAVVENIEEFEMSPEEALDDALSQFKTQDVDLSLIVKDSQVYSSENNGPVVHTSVKITNQLKQFLADDNINEVELEKLIMDFVEECADFAKSSLAGTNDAYTTLYKFLQKLQDSQNNKLLQRFINAVYVLLVGQSKLMKPTDTKYFLQLLELYRADTDILLQTVKVISTSCITNEANKKSYIDGQIVSKAMDLLRTYKDEKELVKAICSLFCVLTADDDSSVPFGNAHETCRLIATEDSGLLLILELCKHYSKDNTILKELFTTLPLLLVRNEFCQQVYDFGGISFMATIFLDNLENAPICSKTMTVFQCLARNDVVKDSIVTSGVVDIILMALSKHVSKPPVCEAGCALIGALALRSPSNAKIIMTTTFPQLLVQVMKSHPDSARVQKSACIAVRNVVYHNSEYSGTFRDLEIADLVNAVLAKHSTAYDEAKAALRDLGCKVELKELWKGEKGSIPQ
ncbi:Armadillo repeat-containing 6 [Octopus vulgaris]|nr:Armadillo repeat-containing 6 [Octopus vulgaris]